MKRSVKIWIALGVLALAGWFGAYVLIGQKNVPVIVQQVAPGLSDRVAEWQGRIDYRALDRDLNILMQRPEMAGLAVAVVEDGKVRFLRTYGVADRATGAAVTPETVFRWASVSKTATGTLAAQLSAQGKVDLDRPLASWHTSLRLPQGAEARVTLAQLLAQQTGLTKNAYDEKLEADEDPVAIRAQLAAAPLQCEPATCHTYQNVAFDAASEILGQAAGKPFDAAVGEQLFRPLGMTSANYRMAGLTGNDSWARPHRLAEVRPLKEAYWRVPAAAGVSSNIGDLAKWMQALMGLRPEILPADTLQMAHGPRVATQRLYSGQLAAAISDARYGLGWRSFTYGGRRVEGHSGAVSGYRATMIFEPATRTGVVAMWNSDWGVPFRIPFAVLDSYHRRPDCKWLDTSAIPLPGAEPPRPAPPKPEEEKPPCPTR
jgi:beta-lactamase class C